MKIAFDVDDVITEAPGLYAAITSSLMACGHEVYIITDFDEHFRAQREKELQRYGIEYTKLVITSHKLDYCKEYDITYALDDDPSYYPGCAKSKIAVIEVTQ